MQIGFSQAAFYKVSSASLKKPVQGLNPTPAFGIFSKGNDHPVKQAINKLIIGEENAGIFADIDAAFEKSIKETKEKYGKDYSSDDADEFEEQRVDHHYDELQRKRKN